MLLTRHQSSVLGVVVLFAVSCGTREAGLDSPGGVSENSPAPTSTANRTTPKTTGTEHLAQAISGNSNAATDSGGQSDHDWASWLGPAGTGISNEQGLLTTFTADGPTILWRTPLGTGYSGLSASSGRLFTMYGRDGREWIGGFDALTGQPLWKLDSDSDFADGRSPGPRSTPVVDGDRVYVLGASGQVRCLSADSGDVIWGFNLLQKFGQRLHEEGFSATPLVDGPRVLIQAGRSIFALDKLTGELLWKALDEPMNHSSPMIRLIGGQRQLVVLTGSNLVGLSAEDGAELWRQAQAGVNVATPVVGPDDQIFTGAAYGFGGQLTKVAGNRAAVVYHNKNLAPHTATPILWEGHLYGFDDRLGIFKCIDFATGEEKWRTRATSKGNIIIADGQFILINEEGQLQLGPVSPEDYRPTATARIFREGLCYTAPTLANGHLYLRSDREMVCIRLKK